MSQRIGKRACHDLRRTPATAPAALDFLEHLTNGSQVAAGTSRTMKYKRISSGTVTIEAEFGFRIAVYEHCSIMGLRGPENASLEGRPAVMGRFAGISASMRMTKFMANRETDSGDGPNAVNYSENRNATSRFFDRMRISRYAIYLINEWDISDDTLFSFRAWWDYYYRFSRRQRGGGFGTLPTGPSVSNQSA